MRVAKRYSQREALGYAYTSLIGFSNQPKASELERWARAALDALGPGHRWLPALAHNLAMQWMDAGFFGPALVVFLRLPADFIRLEAQLGLAANTARAAAAVGDAANYRAARARAEALLDNPAARYAAVVSLINLARAGVLAGEWDHAEATAERAVRLATELSQSQDLMSAEALVESIRADRRVGASARQPRADPAPPDVARLAVDVSAALATSGPG